MRMHVSRTPIRFDPDPSRVVTRLYMPDDESESDLSAEVDRILEKIYREGEAGLTAKERKILETASRKYQQKKR